MTQRMFPDGLWKETAAEAGAGGGEGAEGDGDSNESAHGATLARQPVG